MSPSITRDLQYLIGTASQFFGLGTIVYGTFVERNWVTVAGGVALVYAGNSIRKNGFQNDQLDLAKVSNENERIANSQALKLRGEDLERGKPRRDEY
tara:strand:- start:43 stop:333 length:291 start_codon:yes stop_codon:yes gene_type:complete